MRLSVAKFFNALSALILLVLVQSACALENNAMRLPVDPVSLLFKGKGEAVEIKIEIARDPDQRARGLMFRERLPNGQGMLFVFEDADFQNFWMKDTPQPLDLIFISDKGVIVSIKDGKPNSTDPIPSVQPARFVLELAQGETLRLGIAEGDVATHPALAPSSK